MSLGGGKSIALNNAVARIIAQGLTVCVAAGNESVQVFSLINLASANIYLDRCQVLFPSFRAVLHHCWSY